MVGQVESRAGQLDRQNVGSTAGAPAQSSRSKSTKINSLNELQKLEQKNKKVWPGEYTSYLAKRNRTADPKISVGHARHVHLYSLVLCQLSYSEPTVCLKKRLFDTQCQVATRKRIQLDKSDAV